MATNTPNPVVDRAARAQRIMELWRSDPEFVSARRYFGDGDFGNGSSEAVGWMFDESDARPSEEKWLGSVVDEVKEAASFAAIDAMAAKLAELIEDTPAGLLDGSKPYARELLGMRRDR